MFEIKNNPAVKKLVFTNLLISSLMLIFALMSVNHSFAQSRYFQDTSRTYSENETRALYPGFYLGMISSSPYGPANIGSLSRVGLDPRRYVNPNNPRRTVPKGPTGGAINSGVIPTKDFFRSLSAACQTVYDDFVQPLSLIKSASLNSKFVGALYRCASPYSKIIVNISAEYEVRSKALRNVPKIGYGIKHPSEGGQLSCPPRQTLFLDNTNINSNLGFSCGYEKDSIKPVTRINRPIVLQQEHQISCGGNKLQNYCVQVEDEAGIALSSIAKWKPFTKQK